MSGGVPPGSRAGRAYAYIHKNAGDVRKASKLYEEFTGHNPEELGYVEIPPAPKAACVIGELDAVHYTTVRDGVVERYEHKFSRGDKPLLCVSPDGQQLLCVGGRYVFTDRGIVDLSDTKNLPKNFRKKR